MEHIYVYAPLPQPKRYLECLSYTHPNPFTILHRSLTSLMQAVLETFNINYIRMPLPLPLPLPQP